MHWAQPRFTLYVSAVYGVDEVTVVTADPRAEAKSAWITIYFVFVIKFIIIITKLQSVLNI